VGEKMKKGSAAAKAWGRRMKALRTGIVKRVSKRRRVARRVTRRTGVFRMARRRSRRVSHRKSMMGGTGSLAKSALIGVGAAHFAGYIPVSIPMKEEAVGALAAYFIGGKSVKNAAVGGGAVYLAKMLAGNAGVSGGNSAYGF
jgi:hypothetical protein